MYKRKVQQMQEAIQKETTKMQTQERRRKCEMEGVQSDLQNMKRKVEFYQKYISKLKQLVEEDANRTEDMEDIYNQIKEEASEMEQSPQQPSASEQLLSNQQIEPYQANSM